MSIDRFLLPVSESPAPPRYRTLRRLLCALGLGAAIALCLLYRAEVLDGYVFWPIEIWEHAVNTSIVYFCALALVAVLWRQRQMRPEPGAVSYERRTGGLTIRTPVATTTALLGGTALGLIGLGACSVLTLISSRPPAVWLWDWGTTLMAVSAVCLPVGTDLAIRTVDYALNTRGVTLTPKHISAQAEGSRLAEVPWDALRTVSAPHIAATKLAPAGTFLVLLTDWEAFAAQRAAFNSDLQTVRRIIEFFHQHPEHRQALVDPREAVQLVQRKMAAGPKEEEAHDGR